MRYIALDLETEQIAKVRHSGKIHALFLCGEDSDPACFEWGESAKAILLALISDTANVFVIQNAAFDLWVLGMHGIHIPLDRVVDTMIAAHAINPQQKSYSIEAYGDSIGDPKVDYREEMRKAGLWDGDKDDPSVYDVPFNHVMQEYGCKDAALTIQWWGELREHLEADPRLARNFYEVRMPFVETLISMQGGMHVDLEHAMSVAGELIASIGELQTAFAEKYSRVAKLSWDNVAQRFKPTGKVAAPNLGSPNDVCSLLYEHGWQPIEFKRETGRPVTSQAVLHRLVADPSTPPKLAELAAEMAELKSQTGILNQLMQILRLTNPATGLLHGSWHDTGTVTGRLSSSAPNMQNLSVRHRKFGKKVRRCFDAPPGYAMLIGDLSQIELAIVAWYQERVCGDSRAAEGNRAGKDAHDTNTELWYHVRREDDEEEFEALRKKSKNGAFASGYGAGPKRLSFTLNISVQEAREILDTVEENSEISALKEFVWQQMAQPRNVKPVRKPNGYGSTDKGFLYTVFDGRLFYPNIASADRTLRSKAERQAFNALCQGGCAVLLRMLCNGTTPLLRGIGWVGGTVHDEAILYVKEEHADRVLTEVNAVWNSIVLPSKQGGVYVRADFKRVHNWSEKK